MFTLKIENAQGELFELTHDSQRYAVVGIQGLTLPATAVNTAVGGLADGAFHTLSRVQPRNLVIDIILQGDIEANRQNLYRIFSMKKPCVIYFKNENRDVKITGYVEVLEGDLFVQRERMQISIICPRPFFEDLNAIGAELSGIMRRFEFPFAISTPIPFSEILTTPTVNVENIGQVETGCTITALFLGSVTNIRISNSTTQEFFAVNYSFQAEDILTICTVAGKLSVTVERNNVVTDLINNIVDNSNWFKLPVGTNIFSFAVTSGSLNDVEITFTVDNLFGGV